MSEPVNEYREILDVEDGEFGDPAEYAKFSEAVNDMFATTMSELDVPDNEDEANAIMGQAITKMMRQCFFAGMQFQFSFQEEEPEVTELVQSFPVGVEQIPPIGLTPEMGAALVLGLMSGDGITLRLVVDRGSN